MEKYSIRRIKKTDIESLCELASLEYDEKRVKEFKRRLEDKDELGIIALKEKNIIGFNTFYAPNALPPDKIRSLVGEAKLPVMLSSLLNLEGQLKENTTFSHWLYIINENRKKNMGNRIKKSFFEYASKAGIEHLFTTISYSETNNYVFNWFKKLGYTDLGHAYNSNRRGMELPYHLLYKNLKKSI